MAVTTARYERAGRRVGPTAIRAAGLVTCLGLLVVVGLLSLRIGSIEIGSREVWRALFEYDASSYDQTVVRSLRAPRTVIAIAVGRGLAVAGAVMQAVTRNPLASPSILGVSSGASFPIVTAVYFGGLTASYQYVWFAFAGALVASVLSPRGRSYAVHRDPSTMRRR